MRPFPSLVERRAERLRGRQGHRSSRDAGYRGTVLAMQPGFLPRATTGAADPCRYDRRR
ncbi:hypothetical protein [Streptomyces sp. MA15]|uniref:hypothetical protein n=1 Tax=Streptomyces sp. MA15 TaxID=3055061 RepID=UPI00339D78A0